MGFLCSALNRLGMRDVGTGRFDGFHCVHPSKTEVFWHEGGHGSMLERENLERLVDFVLVDPPGGTPPKVARPPSLGRTPATWLMTLSRFARLVVLLGVIVVLGISAMIAYAVPATVPGWIGWQPPEVLVRAAVFVGVLALLLLLLDRL